MKTSVESDDVEPRSGSCVEENRGTWRCRKTLNTTKASWHNEKRTRSKNVRPDPSQFWIQSSVLLSVEKACSRSPYFPKLVRGDQGSFDVMTGPIRIRFLRCHGEVRQYFTSSTTRMSHSWLSKSLYVWRSECLQWMQTTVAGTFNSTCWIHQPIYINSLQALTSRRPQKGKILLLSPRGNRPQTSRNYSGRRHSLWCSFECVCVCVLRALVLRIVEYSWLWALILTSDMNTSTVLSRKYDNKTREALIVDVCPANRSACNVT